MLVSAYLLLFFKILKAKLRGVEVKPSSHISASDVENAEQLWILDVQKSLKSDKKFEDR